ncbi:hypothetical protein Clacol_000476 [Clathrus columnatus]|uniref:WD40 repeat-like protein n=1 Tax=Clathrus columnatus TaxID=1419009 RepID=A0AAV4ZX78_9AGAM|nr:hypothetical protein Clacol_000476 [Clathrus columnatus]
MDVDIQFTHWVINKKPKTKKQSKPKQVQVISLESDSDIEIIETIPSKRKALNSINRQPPSKKQETIEQESGDSDYENIHQGFEMEWEQSPSPVNVETAKDITADLEVAIQKLHLGRVQLRSDLELHKTRGKITHSNSYSVFKGTRGSYTRGPVSSLYHENRARTALLKHRDNEFRTCLKHLTSQRVFRMADACTWISQAGERILVSSGTPGGGESDTERNLYNEPNTLACLHNERESPEFLHSHFLRGSDPGGDGSPETKSYDVERACFDPNEPNVFVSTGRDGVLTVWNYTTMKIKNLYSDSSKLSYVPVKRWGRETYQGKGNFVHDIVFRGNKLNDRSLFSAPSQNGNLYIHSYTYDGDLSANFTSQTLSKHSSAQAGATLWGHHASSGELFTCMEVKRTSLSNIPHPVYDIHSGKTSYTLDKRSSGEEIALNPEGSMLSLFTQRVGVLDLNLYDVRRKNGRSIASIQNIPCKPTNKDDEPAITRAEWSPDGILLAAATNDHTVHVYDGRFLKSNAPVMEFVHDVQMQKSFSITFLKWTNESFREQNIGLVTGNSGDNRILLWDARCTNRGPKVLAELCSQVSIGCLGDPSKREKPLIIGGLDGWVHVYDTSGHVF